MEELRQGAHIVVATPGRLGDHIQRRSLTLANVRVCVLDEADRMLDMGFAPDVERILRQCPPQRQTLLFSATMPEWVRRLALRHMHDPETVEISTRPEIPSEVRQLYVQTTWADKTDALAQILDQPDVVMALIFVETKRTADVLQAQLGGRGYQVGTAPRRPHPARARPRDAAISRLAHQVPDRDQRRGARPRHRRHLARHQLRRAAHPGRISPPRRAGRDAPAVQASRSR